MMPCYSFRVVRTNFIPFPRGLDFPQWRQRLCIFRFYLVHAYTIHIFTYIHTLARHTDIIFTYVVARHSESAFSTTLAM